ncbi:HERC2 [Bugula neritina]|uniref:HERC2 n=1 Tax=Bugula neritina TaxID=10212 RepID=A0A7J7KI76_BUGNE|nr:HERC2 [Bugula neritina]
MGDSDDQTRPKLVEALKGYKVVDVACGSGDAQTLCATDDGQVWSWGDGDYGKLGRGGSDGCKVPNVIASLEKHKIVRVECGSQFSVALSANGVLFTWGKGDYHRLGHGSDEHVRWPKQVAEFKGKQIVEIACGSLHCVAVCSNNEVFTWGDNDEGQLGDGTTNAIQKPKLVTGLKGKRITNVACGSAHSVAWSTNKPESQGKAPNSVPMEYNHLNHLPMSTLRNRLILLHQFSDLYCPITPLVNLKEDCVTVCLRKILIPRSKDSVFRKNIQMTMMRDKSHGPVIELNRYQAKKARLRGGLAGPDGMKSVFGQVVSKMSVFTHPNLMLASRLWKVDDCGGGYSESIAEISDELQNGSVAILCQTPNGRSDSGANRDCFLLNPSSNKKIHHNMFRMLGILLGVSVRTGNPLSLSLAEPVWKQLVGEDLVTSDITEVDKDFFTRVKSGVTGLKCIKEMSDDMLISADLSFSTSGIIGQEVRLSPKYSKITPDNRQEYINLAIKYRLNECNEQIKWVRRVWSK